MKLEVGMYVRTKYGIFKIRKITKDLAYWKHEKRVIELDRNISEYNYRYSFYKDESIFKGSKFKDNIIDLIEVGDYVNGYKVLRVHIDKEKNTWTIILDNETPRFLIADNIKSVSPIKSIVTKEQFESMSYKVGE